MLPSTFNDIVAARDFVGLYLQGRVSLRPRMDALLGAHDLPKPPKRFPRCILADQLNRLVHAARQLACPHQRAALIVARWSGALRREIRNLELTTYLSRIAVSLENLRQKEVRILGSHAVGNSDERDRLYHVNTMRTKNARYFRSL